MTPTIVEKRLRDAPQLALARIELARMLGHPAFVGFAALTVLMHVVAYIERASDRSGLLYDSVANGPPFWIPVAVGTAIASGLAATRARRDDLDELMDAAPVLRSARSDALVLALVGLGAAAAGLVIVVMTVGGGWNGFPFLLDPERDTWGDYQPGTVLEPTEVTPSVVELAAGPAGLVVWGLLGVVTARYLGSRLLVVAAPLVGFIQLIIVTWTPASPTRWLWPFTHSAQYVGWIELSDDGTSVGVARGFNTAATGWHLLYLLGLAAVLVVAARWRRPMTARSVVAVVAGLIVAVAAGTAQLLVYTPDLHSP